MIEKYYGAEIEHKYRIAVPRQCRETNSSGLARIARVEAEIVASRDANDGHGSSVREPSRRSISAQRASRDKANRISARGGNIWRRAS